MTRDTFDRVMNLRKRDQLWLKASHLEDKEDKTSLREAVRLLRTTIEMGQREACGSLATAYDSGRGVRYSRKMALALWKKSYRTSQGTSAQNIAITLRMEGRITSAILWLHRAIAHDNPDARLDLAKIYLQRGRDKEAQHLLQEFADAGPQSIYEYGPGAKPGLIPDEGFLEGQKLLAELKGEAHA
jgi:TPR repeat protein